MQKKGMILAVSAMSFASSIAFANQQHQKTCEHHPSHSVVAKALTGNSYKDSIHHTYLNGKDHGLWVAGFGQISGAHNSNYLLVHHSYMPQFIAAAHSSTTFSLDNADMLVGFDSHNAGFFSDLGYNYFAGYNHADTNKIEMQGNKFTVQEAYVTDQVGNVFGVKAGKFISDYGYADLYAPIQELASSVQTQKALTGAEVVVAAHGIHASLAGGTATISAANYNGAKPKIIVANVGYEAHTKWGLLDVQGSYTNKAVLDPTAFMPSDIQSPSWLIGSHFATQKYSIRADVQTLRNKSLTYKPWIYDGSFTYVLDHRTTVGMYGNYIYNTPDVSSLHWMLGLTGSYKVNRLVTASAYIQRAQVTTHAKSEGVDDNFTILGALSVKV